MLYTEEKLPSHVVTALMALHRAGSEESRTTRKLREAAVEIADQIVSAVEDAQAEGVGLPRGYKVVDQHSNVGCFTQLRNDDGETLNSNSTRGGEFYLHGDYNRTYRAVGRDGLNRFARDVASGLLDEIAEFIDGRTKQNEGSCEILENAKVVL